MNFRAIPGAENGKIHVQAGGLNATLEVKFGLIHDWAAGVIVPSTTVEKVLAVLQDYGKYKSVYAPEVTDSRLLSRSGDHWRAYLRLYKRKVLTVTLDTEYDVEYKALGDGRWAVLSRSTKMTEVEDGKPLTEGTGYGFLWRLNSYWLIEPRGDGVYMECRSISLSRDIPPGLGWAIKPMVSSLPRESLKHTLEATARALK